MTETKPTNVLEAICAVKSDVGAIGKNRLMNEGGSANSYKFRSIEDIYDAAHEPMAKHGLVIVPHKIVANERRHFEIEKKNREGVVYGVTRGVEVVLTILVHVYGPGGPSDFIELEVVGEAKDYSDKASNKAHTMADKIAVVQVLKIPYRDMVDQDNERPEEGPSRQSQAPRERRPSPPTATGRQSASNGTRSKAPTQGQPSSSVPASGDTPKSDEPEPGAYTVESFMALLDATEVNPNKVVLQARKLANQLSEPAPTALDKLAPGVLLDAVCGWIRSEAAA